MDERLIQLEARTGLSAKQASMLLGIASPTYYQYRRTGRMPEHVERMLVFISHVDERVLENLIEAYVFDNEL